MNYMRQLKRLGLLAAVSVGVSMAAPAQAEFRQVDGHLWLNSSTGEKDAYLIGMVNTLSVYRALQAKKGAIDEQSQLNQYYRAADAGTIEQLRGLLDSWYNANPDRRDMPVLGVIWLGAVQRTR